MLVIGCLIFIVGCSTAGPLKNGVNSDKKDRSTAGKVQREIRIGMPWTQVIEILGHPSVVSIDENRLEVWVYDKVSSETIVVKFDRGHKVRDLAHHPSSF